MKWPILKNIVRPQPSSGDYKSWKHIIASECSLRCVYCAIHESSIGGVDNFHIDHFRPKSKFPTLRNDIANLYLSCAICNRFKGNDWPDTSGPHYPDPNQHDYNEQFTLYQPTHLLVAKNRNAHYALVRLYLNRPQLILERREFFLLRRADDIFHQVDALLSLLLLPSDQSIKAVLAELLITTNMIGKLLVKLQHSSPYNRDDIRR